MWTKLRSRTVVPHDRNNCATWSTLDPDLLVIVAKHCDATSVCRLSQACKSWRDAVASSEQIWQSLVRTHFRRSASLLEALPPRAGFSYAKHYREQFNANMPLHYQHTVRKTTGELSEFVFTIELVTAGETRHVVDEWTRTLEAPAARLDLPMDLREWRKTWKYEKTRTSASIHVDGATLMRLEVFVSRAVSGEIRTRKLYVSSTKPDHELEDGLELFENRALPFTTTFDEDTRDAYVPEMSLVLDTTDEYDTPVLSLQFELDTYHDLVGMSLADLHGYLEHGIDWN